MKLLLSLLFVCSSMLLGAQSKTEQINADFQKVLETVQSNQFKMIFDIATPLSDVNIRIDSAQITINDTIASGYLPYYTGTYGFAMTGNKGIVFDNTILNRSMQIKGRKSKKAIRYQFEVVGKGDSYKITTDIQPDGTCYLFINSLYRSPMSYIGRLKK